MTDLRAIRIARPAARPLPARALPARPLPALVISLDFELHWGVRDKHPTSSGYMANVLGARAAIPRMLDLFTEFEVAATWATVGFLFAESRDELESFHPRVKPRYADPRLDPYMERVGGGEADDPLHYAASLIRLIGSAPRQEVGTHTYSHFYCLEAGADAEAFRQDIASAVAIARARGVEVRSIVLPRNQWNPDFSQVLRDAGVECYRGNQRGWMYRATSTAAQSAPVRAARLMDAHVPLTRWKGSAWHDVRSARGLCDIGATCFLRPTNGARGELDRLRLRRIARGMTRAAIADRIFHLWWHPHNFGRGTTECLAGLRWILEHYRVLQSEHGMRSMTMIEAARHARRLRTLAGASGRG